MPGFDIGDSRVTGPHLTRRRILGLAGALGAGAALAACGDDSPSGSGDKVEGKITVWDPSYKSQPAYTKSADAVDKAFTAKTGVTVDRTAQPFADYDKLLQAAFTGRTGPDAMLMLPGLQGVLRWAKGLRDLTADVAPMRGSLRFWETTTPTLTTDGTSYGVPVGTTGHVFYYNKKLFAQAGLDPEKPPTTFEELVATAKALLAKGIVPFASGNKEGYENQWWFSTLWAGAYPLEDSRAMAKGELPLTDPRVAETFTRLKSLQDQKFFLPTRFSVPLFPDGVDTFSKGKGAMFLGLSDGVGHWVTFNAALGVDNVGYFQPPGIGVPQAPHLPVICSYVWSVPTFAENTAAAVEYVKFAGSVEAQRIQYDTAKAFPNNGEVKVNETAPQYLGMFKDYQERPSFQPAHQLLAGNTLNELSTLINEVLQNRQSLTSALTKLQQTNAAARTK